MKLNYSPKLNTPEVLYEDNHLLILNKPAGILTQGDQTGDVPLVEIGKRYLKKKYKKPGQVFLGVVHRIDRPVSGAVVFARTSKSLSRMTKLFRDKEFKKTYWAVVRSKPPAPEGHLVHWLQKDRKQNKVKAYSKESGKSLRSELTYRLSGQMEGNYLIEVIPITGRPHQIRVQLAAIGSPICGDLKYGFKNANADGNISLHAYSQEFIHPVKKDLIKIHAPLPDDPFWQKFARFDENNDYS